MKRSKGERRETERAEVDGWREKRSEGRGGHGMPK